MGVTINKKSTTNLVSICTNKLQLTNVICLKQLLKYINGGVFFIIDQSILTQTQLINSQQQTHAQVQKFLWQGGGGVLKTLFCQQRISQRVVRTSLKKQLDLRGVLTSFFYSQFLIFQGLGLVPPVPLWINP